MTLSLQFIGCGDAFGSGGRFNTCFRLYGATTNLLIDCGASSLVAMKQLAVDRNAIRLIVITHFHADHFGGIPFFILDAQFFSKRREPLTIVGPPGLSVWYERVMETAFPGSSGAAQKFELNLIEVSAGGMTTIDDVEVRMFQAVHGPLNGPFYAVRITAEDRSVAYTGDTEWTPALIPAARDADVFIAEAYFRDKTIATHLSLKAIEAHLEELGPKRLIPDSHERRHAQSRRPRSVRNRRRRADHRDHVRPASFRGLGRRSNEKGRSLAAPPSRVRIAPKIAA